MSSSGFNYYNFPKDKIEEMIYTYTSPTWQAEFRNGNLRMSFSPFMRGMEMSPDFSDIHSYLTSYMDYYNPPPNTIYAYIFGDIQCVEQDGAAIRTYIDYYPDSILTGYQLSGRFGARYGQNMPVLFDTINTTGDVTDTIQFRGIIIYIIEKP